MENKSCCVDCSLLVGAQAALGPHNALRLERLELLALGTAEHYQCRVCKAKLLRELKTADPDAQWRWG